MPSSRIPPMPLVRTDDVAVERLRDARVLLAGLGNIGSFLATLLASLVGFVRLVDRDLVEIGNTANQCYGPEHVGQAKVDATADRLLRLAPRLKVERRGADIEDLPWEDFADVDVAFAGFDALRPRQVLAERLFGLRIPYIDGGVGQPLLVRAQVLLPDSACLECAWSAAHYRQLTTEYPCHPRTSAQAPPTGVPSCAGAAAAALMVAQCIRLFGPQPPRQSYEINGDLLVGRFIESKRRRNARCRFNHEDPPRPPVGCDPTA